jgi:hypothetical protein
VADGETRKRRRRRKRDDEPAWRRTVRTLAAGVTFLLAVLGAYTGTSAWLDQRRISVRVTPAPYPAATQAEPIEAALVNRSQRSVALTSGRVLLDGEDVGDVTALRTELPLGWRFLIRRDVVDGARPLPVTLEPGTSTTAAFFWDTTGERASDLVRRRMNVPLDDAVDERAPRRRVPLRMELELHLDPGGTKTNRVTVVQPRSASSLQLSSPDMDAIVRNRRVTGLQATGALPEGVATLRIWDSRSAAPVRVVSRPISGPGTRFPIDVLRRGRYSWALETRDDTFTGQFVSPCDPKRKIRRVDLVSIEECQEELLSGFGGP